ncbi:MAG: TIM barrel protein [Limnobacter sp.]|uniref:hydroxypyruvate isomerase family protein n=1 Tax=Limnobacter sp. TaxID=2003368 RepID=UPI0032EA985A
MRLAANLSWLYTEFEFLDRLQACAEDGFRHAECMFPYEYSVSLLREKANSVGVQWVLINAPAGNWAQGDRGLAVDLARRDEFRRSVERAIDYANTLGVRKVHVLAGVVNLAEPASVARAWACYEENLAWLADATVGGSIDWLIEPINRQDVPGYLLTDQAAAHALIQRLDRTNLGVQMDLYHCQRVEGDALDALARYLPTGRVKHLQIAGVPDRDEPACAGLDYSQVCRQLKALAYTGHIGCEYRPKGATRDGLGWIRQTGFSGTMESFES